jgi:hypothetical protein
MAIIGGIAAGGVGLLCICIVALMVGLIVSRRKRHRDSTLSSVAAPSSTVPAPIGSNDETYATVVLPRHYSSFESDSGNNYATSSQSSHVQSHYSEWPQN